MKGQLYGLDTSTDFDKDNLVSFGRQTKNVFHLWLIDDVGDASCYMKWFDILQNASEDDLVVIHINSYGGQLMTAAQITTQIKICRAQVLCQIESACCSAATMIALACDGLYCYPHAYMMIHTSSGCSFGKQSDIKREEEFYNPWLENFFNETYKHFLTKKEIQEVLAGKDMWLHAPEVMERFKKRVDIINRGSSIPSCPIFRTRSLSGRKPLLNKPPMGRLRQSKEHVLRSRRRSRGRSPRRRVIREL